MAKTYTQYLAMYQDGFCVEENKWNNVAPCFHGLGVRYYRKEADAKADIARLIGQRNREHRYGADGKREELTDSINGIGVSMVCDRASDDLLRVRRWKIQRREVTEWEDVEGQEV